ncbi:MAG: ABC transporter ATP-binding protein [Deltaproteobacteria bacterium]|nr:ABC transporter ATP-binding protein [Deltaproteobacteria bacterium]
MIQIEGLSKSFGAVPILRTLKLDIGKNQITFIIGHSGAGKSVLLKLMLGLIKPDEGRILVDGEDITTFGERRLDRLRRRFGFLFQNAALFDSMTVEDNIAFPLREHTRLQSQEIRERVRQTMDMVGLEDIEDRMPSEISGGMRKRAGLARAIIMKPEILLFDEPTTGLDPILAEVVDDLILKTQKQIGVTSVVVSHDIPAALRIADKIAMIYEGRVRAFAGSAELQALDDPVVQQFLKGESEGPMFLDE